MNNPAPADLGRCPRGPDGQAKSDAPATVAADPDDMVSAVDSGEPPAAIAGDDDYEPV